MYLPVVAQLEGVLYIQPYGHSESCQDVLRLSSNLTHLQKQQGYLRVTPEVLSDYVLPLPFQELPALLPNRVTQSCCLLKVGHS